MNNHTPATDHEHCRRYDAKSRDLFHPEYKCIDISEYGAKFYCRDAIPIGNSFTLIFNTPELPLSICCKVVWCRLSESIFDNSFHVGVQFENLSNANQRRIRHFLNLVEV